MGHDKIIPMARRFPDPAYLLLVIFLVLFFLAGTPRLTTYAAIFDLAFVFLAGLKFWFAAAVAESRTDSILYRLSIGCFIWTLAICLRLCEMALNQPGYGTLADSFWVVGYFPLLHGAYLWFLSATPTARRKRTILVAFLTCGIPLLLLFLGPLLRDPARSVVLKALDMLYPTLDLVIAGLLAAPAFSAQGKACRTLMASVLLLLVCDLLFSYFGSDPSSSLYAYLDLPYTLAYFLLALAGKQQHRIILGRRLGLAGTPGPA